MSQGTTTQTTIMSQINARELAFARFKIMIDGENTVWIKRGQKAITITYNESADLYDLELITMSNYSVKGNKQLDGMYADQLRDTIESFFPGFEYVMEQLLGVRA